MCRRCAAPSTPTASPTPGRSSPRRGCAASRPGRAPTRSRRPGWRRCSDVVRHRPDLAALARVLDGAGEVAPGDVVDGVPAAVVTVRVRRGGLRVSGGDRPGARHGGARRAHALGWGCPPSGWTSCSTPAGSTGSSSTSPETSSSSPRPGLALRDLQAHVGRARARSSSPTSRERYERGSTVGGAGHRRRRGRGWRCATWCSAPPSSLADGRAGGKVVTHRYRPRQAHDPVYSRPSA